MEHMNEGLFMTFITRPILFIFGEDAVKAFSKEKAAIDKSPEYVTIQDRMGDGLITRNGERWRSHRKLINPAFHMRMLQMNVPLFNHHAAALIKDMEKMVGKPSVDVLGVLKYHYFNSLRESVFGLKQNDVNEEKLLRFSKLTDNISDMTAQRISYPWLRPKLLIKFFPFGRKFHQDIKESDDFILNVIYEMKNHVISKESTDMEDFGSHLRKSFTYILLQKHLSDPSFTLEEVHDEVKTILIAGYETAAFTTMYCLFLLGLHPEIQEKAYNEILSMTSGDYITYEESSNLIYLECIIMESLRVYPIVPVYARNLSEDVQCGKYKVFKDTTIAFVPYLAHRNPKIFPEPELFKPERFLNTEARKSPCLIPFAEGNRVCIGKFYGLLEVKIFLAHILRHFKFTSLDRREDIRLRWAILINPIKPIRMKITLRSDASLSKSV